MLVGLRYSKYLGKGLLRAIRMGCSQKKAYEGPVATKPGVQHTFKAETKKLLDIVAKSLYTDKEVFIRELLSNSSDAIEKRRFLAMKEGLDEGEYEILVTTNSDKRQVIIQDNGVGMSEQEMIDNLGTIARSGSQEFVAKAKSESLSSDSIIGQFGVGFYSSFIVGHNIEVVSRQDKGQPAYCWSSDGSGEFTVSEVTDCEFERGTKIVVHLRPECEQFSQRTAIKETISKYSNFINSAIYLDGEKVNLSKALWSREKRELSDEDYRQFYKDLTRRDSYYSHLHYSTDVPLLLKSLFYFPQRNEENFGQRSELQVDLYSRKVCIKKGCKEILPDFLRFVAGVVDCEDLPLNISRENYQDSALIASLRDLLTKRILRHLQELAERDPPAYAAWFAEFETNFKEGVIQSSFKLEIAELLRYRELNCDELLSLQDYLGRMKPGQRSIYFFSFEGPAPKASSFLEPYRASQVPVLMGRPFEEVTFMQLGNYKGHTFVNIETNSEDMSKLFVQAEGTDALSNDEFNVLAAWVRDRLNPVVSKVVACTKPIKGPAYLTSPLSSTMRSMSKIRSMMEKLPEMQEGATNLTLEINLRNDTIRELNELRKTDENKAELVLKVIVDSCMARAGIPYNVESSYDRIDELIKLSIFKP